jgi:hypothetical protein
MNLPFISSWSGVVALILSAIALAGVFVGYGRWLEKLNGVGRRVHKLETESAAGMVEHLTLSRQIDKLIEQHGQMLEKIGESKRSAESCHEDTEQMGIRIGSAVSDLTREVAAMNSDLATRITRVETILDQQSKQRWTDRGEMRK